MLLSTARQQVLNLLDDPDGQRWSLETGIFTLSNEVDLAIQGAAVECMSLYVHSGGDFFDVVEEVTTADGTYSFNPDILVSTGPDVYAVNNAVPLMIKAVQLKSGTNNYRIHGTREQDIQVDSTAAHNVKVRLVYTPNFLLTDPGLAATDNIPFTIGVGSTMEFHLFTQWVIAVAAKNLTPKENETNSSLDDRIGMLQNACTKSPETPKTVTFPSTRDALFSIDASRYRWSYVARDNIANKTCCLRMHKVSLR